MTDIFIKSIISLDNRELPEEVRYMAMSNLLGFGGMVGKSRTAAFSP